MLLVLGIGAGVLEFLGPPPASPPGPPPVLAMTAVEPALDNGPRPAPRMGGSDITAHGGASQSAARLPSQSGRPGRDTPGPIADPDPSLLEPYPGGANLSLPRVAIDGRAPMAVYAAGFDPTNVRPRVGMLIAGIGLSEADSMAAVKDLPRGVTLAITPYAGDIGRLLAVARIAEHEYLLSVPMEPQGYPVNDPDDRHALMTSLSAAENLERLRWALARFSGYVGVTSALGPMRGERLTAAPIQFASVLKELGHRGLLFVDARTSQPVPPYAWSRSVDVVIDQDPVDAAVLDKRLDTLSHIALDKGSALGIVWVPRPVTLARVAAWTNSLAAKGLALAPVSALVVPPAGGEVEK
jgi:polysaccharide deacetylase 2 family uncharacterized protein YibQ